MKAYARIGIFNSLVLLILAITVSSCLKLPKSDGPKKLPSKIGSFDFATTADVQLDVNYDLTDYSISFEVYSQDPMDVVNDMQVKKNDIEPVFRAITDMNGRFSGIMHIPTAVRQVFIYTQYVGVPTSVQRQIVNNCIDFDLTQAEKAAIKSRAEVSTRAGVRGNVKTLGAWNEEGKPDYLLFPRVKLTGDLMNNIMFSLPESRHGIGHTNDPNGFIREDEAIGDIRILKSTKINLIFMHEGASMHSTLGYYSYKTDSEPAAKEELTRIVAFPNFSYAYSGGELSSGDRVQLKYWDGTQFVDEFPAGVTIGWFLISSGFIKPSAEVNGNSSTIYYSNPKFNPETNNRQHCVALRDKEKKIIALGFEDQNRDKLVNGAVLSDSDFNDAVFYIETDVEGGADTEGIPDIIPDPTPTPDPSNNFIDYSGTLVFEDLWPSKGDYDMNDVVIDYQSRHYRNSGNQVTNVVDKFTPRWSGASLNNGFGYQIGVNNARISKVLVESELTTDFKVFKTDGKGLELSQSKATIMLFENINEIMKQQATDNDNLKSFTVSIEFTSPVRVEELTPPPYNPFIVTGCIKKDLTPGNRDKEVHLPNKRPTDLANQSLLGTVNDKSDPKQGYYYISDENYMFALNVPINFVYPEEKQRLEHAYGRYSSWVSSNGVNDADWYKDQINPK